MTISNWMSWEGGVDLAASTIPGSAQPNIIVHVARLVHTPVGSAPSGMVLFQPDLGKAPLFMGFVSTSLEVGNYFAPKVFADTPFEAAPTLLANIVIDTSHLPNSVSAHVLIDGYQIEAELSNFESLVSIDRSLVKPTGGNRFSSPFLPAGFGSSRNQSVTQNKW